MKKQYTYFLFDLDDTLLDFKSSEKLSFFHTMNEIGIKANQENLFHTYQKENSKLWKMLEQGLITKDHIKSKRFKILFETYGIQADYEKAGELYLEVLGETVVLLDHAIEICEHIKQYADIGIITNGIEHIQHKRINSTKLKDYINFICVSESCGFAKPDVRFFEHAMTLAKNIKKENALVIGDRYEADILGAKNFGVDSCWFNHKNEKPENPIHTYEIKSLKELREL